MKMQINVKFKVKGWTALFMLIQNFIESFRENDVLFKDTLDLHSIGKHVTIYHYELRKIIKIGFNFQKILFIKSSI